MLNSHNEKIIRCLLSDNELVNFKLNQAVQLLLELREQHQQSSENRKSTPPVKTMNNLQAVNVLLANLASMGPTRTAAAATQLTQPSLTSSKKCKTFNEIVALEMLEQFDWIKLAIQSIRYENEEKNGEFTNPTDSLDKLEQLVRKIKAYKATKFSRLYQPECLGDANLLLNVCIKCKGEIKIV
jgi:virulence-associated protein VapD